MEKIPAHHRKGAAPGTRFIVLDALRGLTVILAMLDHVKVQFVPDFHGLVPLTRFATPCFIILFGAMIEIAYLSKLRNGTEVQKIKHRMAARFVTCWGLAIVLTVAAVVSGNLGLQAGWKSVLGLDFGRFNEIFVIYAALFLACIGLLGALVRFGAGPLLLIAGLGWLAQPHWGSVLPAPGYASSFFLGYGAGYGPALLPAFTFLGFGVAIGEMLTGRRKGAVAFAVVLLAAIVFAAEISYGPMEAARRFLAHRWINHAGYYAFGIIGFCGLAAGLYLAAHRPALQGGMQALAKIGTQTLFVYGAGNLVLNLMPMAELSRSSGVLAAASFMAALVWLALIGPAGRNAMGLGLPNLWGRRYGPFRDALAGALVQALPARSKTA